MNKVLWTMLLTLTLTLTACGTTSGTKASVEDRAGGSSASGSAATTGKTDGTQTSGLGGKGVAGNAMDGSNSRFSDPRKDPASPLSSRSVFFDYDSFTVKDEYRSMLEAHAGYLLSKRDARVILQGNTDERGSREYNLALGQKRAEAVRKALSVLGVGESQMEAVSFGEEKPRSEAQSEEGYSQNRRTDVVYADE